MYTCSCSTVNYNYIHRANLLETQVCIQINNEVDIQSEPMEHIAVKVLNTFIHLI